MSQESESYNLKGSTALVGQLYPILKAKDGSILDGFHRSGADEWKSQTLENIDTEEKKLAARLISNFHRRRVPREEKERWINDLAALYRDQGLKVYADGDKSQGANEIADRIGEVTGISRRTVLEYLKDDFKQNNKKRENLNQHETRSKASEIIYNALSGRGCKWANRVLERYQKELLTSPAFRAQVLSSLSKIISGSGTSISNDEELPKGVYRGKDGLLYQKKKRGRKKSKRPSEKLDVSSSAYYEMFREECPNCTCATCPHAEECIERVRAE